MSTKIFKCTCCNEEVTVPYFYKDGVYGYTCIKKVNPTAKKSDRFLSAGDAIKAVKAYRTAEIVKVLHDVTIGSRVGDVVVFTLELQTGTITKKAFYTHTSYGTDMPYYAKRGDVNYFRVLSQPVLL